MNEGSVQDDDKLPLAARRASTAGAWHSRTPGRLGRRRPSSSFCRAYPKRSGPRCCESFS